uniref:DNA primase subunit 2 n=1 Tax=Hucho hucho TaxID=62062 RepID=A0A4W5LI84_9TELE
MDPGKVRAVVDWPQPTSRVQLQRFLGFGNYYLHFIRGYSTLASPLSALTSPKVPFTWSPAAYRAFQYLKHHFSTAPILVHPDPSRQFVVEADSFCISHVLSFLLLQLTARSLPAVHHGYVGQDYSRQKSIGNMSLEQIDPLSVKSYPLCMRQPHRLLRESHHLRHGGRMQYNIFLKGIGLTLDQALQFWRSEFVKGKVDADKFDKAYAYSIHHMFGKEGKRTDYTPYSCMKVILSNLLSQGDQHGCPFRHSAPELLKQKLRSYKVSPSCISQVGNALACQKYSKLSHSIEDSGLSLNHTNQYLMECQKLLGGPVAGVKVEVEDNPTPGPGNLFQKVAAEMAEDLDSFFQDA